MRRAGIPMGGGGLSLGGLVIVIILALVFGVDPMTLLQGSGQMSGPSTERQAGPLSDRERELGDFVSVVLADTEDTWNGLFSGLNQRYQEPKLVMFSGSVRSACGFQQAAVGPFYCPADKMVYIDLSFFDDLHQRFKAPGDFAQAYVIAHEVGHHVQNLTGISGQVHQAQQRMGKAQANDLSVRLELQADCLAGVWGYHADKSRQLLERGDIEEGLAAAAAIGDDRLQKQSRGYVSPESFTHGSSAQRVRWFKQGLNSGDMSTCNTFDTPNL